MSRDWPFVATARKTRNTEDPHNEIIVHACALFNVVYTYVFAQAQLYC